VNNELETSWKEPDKGNLYLFLIKLYVMKILWHVDPLLGHDREMNNYTTAVAKVRTLQTTAVAKQELSNNHVIVKYR
jgi:hypothetical protein